MFCDSSGIEKGPAAVAQAVRLRRQPHEFIIIPTRRRRLKTEPPGGRFGNRKHVTDQ